jgi:hypothetical protein
VQIDKLGLYIRTRLEPLLNTLARSNALMQWEETQDATDVERGPRWWRLDWPILAIFAVPGIGLGGAAAVQLDWKGVLVVLAVLAVLAQAAFIILWVKVCFSRPQRYRHVAGLANRHN